MGEYSPALKPASEQKWVQSLLDRAIAMQRPLLDQFPESMKRQGYGRNAEFIVDGPNGGVFRIWLTERGLAPSPDGVPIRNRIWMTEATLLDLITPDISPAALAELVNEAPSMEAMLGRLYPRLEVGTALARRLVIIGGEIMEDKTLVDTGEIASIFSRVVRQIFFPLTARTLLKAAKRRRP